MIQHPSFQAVEQNFLNARPRPLYESYCFSRVPATIAKLLTGHGEKTLPQDTFEGADYDTVLLFFVDGFGWRFFEKYAERFPFLQRFIDRGIVSKLTAQFPSTTAAHVTCINTGLTPAQSGVYEWFYYEPLVDQVICPLTFSYAGDHTLETLKSSGVPFEAFYPKQTFYEMLHREGVDSYVVQNGTIAHSSYSRALFKGAAQIPYNTTTEALTQLAEFCNRQKEKKSYVYVYFGEIDAMGHRKGIDSPQFAATMTRFWNQVEEVFWNNLKVSNQKIACLLIADHGMVSVDPKTTLYLNLEYPHCVEWMKRNREGKPIVPAGSCRDFFLHIEDKFLSEAQSFLQKNLAGKAQVVPTAELIQGGFFGDTPPSQVFLDRVGNLVILPDEGEAVWWFEKHRFEQHFYGAHGGLSRHEMEIPFLFMSI